MSWEAAGESPERRGDAEERDEAQQMHMCAVMLCRACSRVISAEAREMRLPEISCCCSLWLIP